MFDIPAVHHFENPEIGIDIWAAPHWCLGVESLAEHIRKVLNYSKSCTIFRPEVARVWPQIIEMTEQRNAAIEEFARERGWTATIVDPGIIVTFEKTNS